MSLWRDSWINVNCLLYMLVLLELDYTIERLHVWSNGFHDKIAGVLGTESVVIPGLVTVALQEMKQDECF